MIWLKECIVGFFLGVANIIPGVSGGSFLLIFGIYEKVIEALNKLNGSVVKNILSRSIKTVFSFGKNGTAKQLLDYLTTYNIPFLIRLLIGALVAIVVLSSIMKILLTSHFSITYAFFFGLILVSIIIPVKMLKNWKPLHLLFLVLGASLTIYVSSAVNPYDKAKSKSDMYQVQYEKGEDKTPQKKSLAKVFTFTGQYSVSEYLYSGFCGAVSISAMVLPGISGSLVMILMGEYFNIITAISSFKSLNCTLDTFLYLGVFALGMLIGLASFARLVNFIFKRFYDGTMMFLIGLMVGTLYTLWPFKEYITMDQYVKSGGVISVIKDSVIYTNVNIIPQDGSTILYTAISALIGGLIMWWFSKKEIDV